METATSNARIDRPLLRGNGPELGPFTTRFAPGERTLLHVLTHQAAERGDHDWLVFDGTERLTFGAALEQASALGHALEERLGAEGGQVALFLRNQIEFMPAFLGPMTAGCVTVPLNADSRGPLLEYAIAKSEAKVLIARADLLDRIEALDGLGDLELIVVCGEGDAPARVGDVETVRWADFLAGKPTTPPRDLPDDSVTALIQFTSGTTGKSKGVLYPHHFLYLYSALLTDGQERTPDEVLSTALPLFHVAALHQVAGSSLHAGCTGHLKSRFSASNYWKEIAADGATWSILLGPMAEIILKSTPEAPAHRLENIFCVPFPPNGEEFERRFGCTLQWQGYGMTEIYPLPMAKRMIPDVPRDTIGAPPPWLDFGVVDADDRMVAPGEVGELVFRPRIPHAMTKGYFKDPATTTAAFRNLMFHTGDLATYDERGLLHYRGRPEDRIRRRGENISAVELEFVTMRHEHVVEASAYGVPAEFGEHEVKVDLVVKDGADLDLIHAWLCEQLPRYMIPRYLEAIAEMPKTPSQKIQKYKLAEASLDRPEVRTYEPPPRR